MKLRSFDLFKQPIRLGTARNTSGSDHHHDDEPIERSKKWDSNCGGIISMCIIMSIIAFGISLIFSM